MFIDKHLFVDKIFAKSVLKRAVSGNEIVILHQSLNSETESNWNENKFNSNVSEENKSKKDCTKCYVSRSPF